MGIKTVVDSGRRTGVKVLCWLSLALSIIAGPLLAKMWVGDIIIKLLEAFAFDWLPLLVLVGLVCFFMRDMVLDWMPNYLAIISTLVAPSVASASNGELSDTVAGWTKWTLDLVAEPLYRWAGTTNASTVAVAVAAAALIFAQRTVKKSSSSVTVEA